jgi:lipopolysaccharide export system protein LptA
MLKKIILFVATFALVCVAYIAYQWQDTTPVAAQKATDKLDIQPLRAMQSQPATEGPAITYRDAKIPPGEAPRVRVFGPDGQPKIVFQASKWNPTSDTEFHIIQPTARVLLPGGQLAYVRADEGDIVVQRDDRSNYNPKRGKLIGNVQLFIDRTKPSDRKLNPDAAEPENHPEAIVKVWMDDVAFDLDLARLETDGPIKVQSVDATVEGRGLVLVWNEVNRHIKLLRIAEGKRASIRMRSLVQLGIAQDDDEAGKPAAPLAEAVAEPADTGKQAESPAETDEPPAAKHVPALKLSDLDDTADAPQDDRIDTYQIVFSNNIVAEQRQGLRVVGRMKADVLELVRDFGAQERSAVEHAPGQDQGPGKKGKGKARAGAKKPPVAGMGQPAAAVGAAATAPAGATVKKESSLELQWTGELVVTPVISTGSQPAEGAGRFHVTATGNPVELHDRETGDATCSRLDYRDETKQVLLTGTAERPVTLQADARRQLYGEKVFLDRKSGVARVEGSGRMLDRKGDKSDDEWPECIQEQLAKAREQMARATGRTAAPDAPDEVGVTWKQGVEIRFGQAEFEQPDPATGRMVKKKREFLKSARLQGEACFRQPGQSLVADMIDIAFAEPRPGEARAGKGDKDAAKGVAAEGIVAQGSVRMTNDDSVITCDRLEVEMTTNDVGRNVPRVGKAFGNVVARQGKQEIRASDQMVVMLESVPRRITPTERERYEAAAKACGYTSDSPEYKQVEAKLQLRREIVVRSLNARKDVVVLDPGEEVDVAADMLDCLFDDARQISKALVMGSPEVPAHVAMTDFYIRGPQIAFNVADESADVPGEGIMRFYTRQDLSGRRTSEPVPVVVTWKNSMSFRGKRNSGLFTGSVRAVSEGTILDCRDELSLRFENLPREEASTQPAGSDSRWLAGRVFDLLDSREKAPRNNASAAGLSRSFRKRLAYIQTAGDTVIASSEHEKPQPRFGPFSSILTSIMPDAAGSPASQPSPADQRLLSFVRINGPRVTIDLNNEHMVVEGAGNLLVLDYRRLPGAAPRPAPAAVAGGSITASLQSDGPSQTVFTWQNSMSYLNKRNVAVLDKGVVMKHASGSEVAMPEQVASAMRIDPKQLAAMKARRAELTCENLVVEFARNRARAEGESSLSSATELQAFQATHRVRMQENNREVGGETVTYDSTAGMVRIQGSPQTPAYAAQVDERTGDVPASWRGLELEWNLKSNVITVTGASITSTGK